MARKKAKAPSSVESRRRKKTEARSKLAPRKKVAASRKKAAGKKGKNPGLAKKKGSGKLTGGAIKASLEANAPPPSQGFPVVGMGASAGGLEALKNFFTAMPSGQAIAFVVVTHQHAGHVSMLAQLLAQHTSMVVCDAADGMRIEPNRVYVAPSSGQLHLLGGKLLLIPTEAGLHLPIDSFFRSLAIDQKEHAIGIVLSGTGTDGTLGIKAIKGESGMVMVQAPDSAAYDGMPRSAIATGLVDFVLPVEAMPQRLLQYASGPFISRASATLPPSYRGLSDVMPKIFVLMRNRTRHDFSHYKASTVRRRIERRMSVNQIIGAQDYLRFLQETPHELDVLFRELLIGVTSFFRDPEAFEALANDVLPPLVRAQPDGSTVRMWSAGCSTGEEAYSLAITAQEVIERVNPHVQFQVFATDLDERAIDVARRGVYPSGIAADITPDRLERFFAQDGGHYRVRKELREHLVFATQDVISDPPFTKLNLLACRNLLIYLDAELQKKLLPVFHYAIEPGGVLFLGSSESIGSFTSMFRTMNKKWKIFERQPATQGMRLLAARSTFALTAPYQSDELPVPDQPPKRHVEMDLLRLLERRMLRCYVPPTVITSDRGEIVYIHGRTGAYLEPAPGEPSNNILSMARQGLELALTTAMRRAASQKAEVVQRGVHVTNNGDSLLVDVVVRPLAEPELIRGLLMVSFEESHPPQSSRSAKAPAAAQPKSRGRVAELEQQLQQLQDHVRDTTEIQETTNEELKSSNEELQSTNEELQSTNEELETSKEEMQSLNEELQTVNAELQMKIEDLAVVNDDMTNLLNNTNIATVFLNNDLCINRFTNAASDVIKFIPTDVGRPIGDLVSSLDYDLVKAGREVLATLMTRETEAQADDGRWYLVRLMPYRTSQNVIDGLVATFVDITKGKQAEQQVAKTAAYAESIVNTVREPLMVLDDGLRVVSCNGAYYRMFSLQPAQVSGRLIFDIGEGEWDIPQLRKRLELVLPRDSVFENLRVEFSSPTGGRRTLMLNGRRLEQAVTLPGKILLAFEDVTERDLSDS